MVENNGLFAFGFLCPSPHHIPSLFFNIILYGTLWLFFLILPIGMGPQGLSQAGGAGRRLYLSWAGAGTLRRMAWRALFILPASSLSSASGFSENKHPTTTSGNLSLGIPACNALCLPQCLQHHLHAAFQW